MVKVRPRYRRSRCAPRALSATASGEAGQTSVAENRQGGGTGGARRAEGWAKSSRRGARGARQGEAAGDKFANEVPCSLLQSAWTWAGWMRSVPLSDAPEVPAPMPTWQLPSGKAGATGPAALSVVTRHMEAQTAITKRPSATMDLSTVMTEICIAAMESRQVGPVQVKTAGWTCPTSDLTARERWRIWRRFQTPGSSLFDRIRQERVNDHVKIRAAGQLFDADVPRS